MSENDSRLSQWVNQVFEEIKALKHEDEVCREDRKRLEQQWQHLNNVFENEQTKRNTRDKIFYGILIILISLTGLATSIILLFKS